MRPRIYAIVLFASFVLASVFLVVSSGVAHAQAELAFGEDELHLRLSPPGFRVDKACAPETGEVENLGRKRSEPGVQTTAATVFVTNDGDQTSTGLRFGATIRNEQVNWASLRHLGFYQFFDPTTVPVPVNVYSDKNIIGPSSAEPCDPWIETEPPSDLRQVESWTPSGYLNVSTDEGGIKPGRVRIDLVDTAPWYKATFNHLLIPTIVFVAVGLYYHRRYKEYRGVTMSTKLAVNADVKESWASKIAAAGAVLGTVLAASVLPESTFLLPKEQFVALIVLFGLLIVLAAVFHNSVLRVRSYLFASVLTVGAALGQVIVALLLFEEIGIQGSMTPLGVRLLQILLLIGLGMVFWAAFNRIIPTTLPAPNQGSQLAA